MNTLKNFCTRLLKYRKEKILTPNKMTEGNIIKTMAFFAVPMLLSSLFQQFFNMADLYFVGNYLGKNAAAALGASSVLITCMIGLLTGISTGAGIIAARLWGSGDTGKLYAIAYYSFFAAVVTGLCLTVVGTLSREWLFSILQIPKHIRKDALSYSGIYFIGIAPMLVFHVISSLFKAVGEAKRPLYCLMIGGIINLFLNYYLIIVMKFRIEGAAWATVLSQSMVAILIVIEYRIFDKKIRPVKKDRESIWNLNFVCSYLKEIIYIGLPAGIQAVLLTFSNLIMQYRMNQLGADQIAAFAAYFKIEMLLYLPILAMGQTILIFVSQNKGAGNYIRVRRGIISAILSMSVFVFLSALGLLAFGKELFQIFIKDEAVIYFGIQIITVTFPWYFLYVVLELSGNAIRGLGNSLIPMCNSLFCLCGIRILLVLLWVDKGKDIRLIVSVYPITWFLCALMNVGYLWITLKKRKKE